MKNDRVFLTKQLEQDNVFVPNEIKSLEELTNIPSRKGLEMAVISNGKIVNVVSDGYGHLPNERFFKEVEKNLNEAGIGYKIRSINRDDRSFAVDYILNDEKMVVTVKNGADKIVPMLRFVNSYDGSCKTSGNFGFYRELCSNGLHVAHTKVGFGVKHRGQIASIVLPEIGSLIKTFYDNEYYSLRHKFEVLAERKIENIDEFVEMVADATKLFKFESSEKNPLPSLNARTVIDTINKEAKLLGEQPNFWLGYNAFNELLHGKMKKTFEVQKKLDAELIEVISEM